MSEFGLFEIILASPPEHDEIVAEIYFKGKFAALLAHDDLVGNFSIEFPDANQDDSLIARFLPLDGFLEAIREAKRRLTSDDSIEVANRKR